MKGGERLHLQVKGALVGLQKWNLRRETWGWVAPAAKPHYIMDIYFMVTSDYTAFFSRHTDEITLMTQAT